MTALSVLPVKCTLVERAKCNQSPSAWLMVKPLCRPRLHSSLIRRNKRGCKRATRRSTQVYDSRLAIIATRQQSSQPPHNRAQWLRAGSCRRDGVQLARDEIFWRNKHTGIKNISAQHLSDTKMELAHTHTHTLKVVSTPVLPSRLGRRPAVWLWPWPLTWPDIPTPEGGQTHRSCTLTPATAAACAAPNTPRWTKTLCWSPGESTAPILRFYPGVVRTAGWWSNGGTAGCFVKVENCTRGLGGGELVGWLVSEREVMRCGERRRGPSGQREDNDDSSLLWSM